MSDTPFFTVIVPVYNIEKYLKEALDSVIVDNSDSLSLTQIIAVDDGSTDSSGDIIDDYAKNYKGKVIAIHQKNGGLSCARNTGIKNAIGGGILFFWTGMINLCPDHLATF